MVDLPAVLPTMSHQLKQLAGQLERMCYSGLEVELVSGM